MQMPEDGVRCLRNGAIDDFVLSCGCWELAFCAASTFVHSVSSPASFLRFLFLLGIPFFGSNSAIGEGVCQGGKVSSSS